MPSVTVRAETEADHAAIARVVGAAFSPGEGEVRLVDAIRRAPGFDPRLSLVAEDDGAVIGHLLFSPCLIETATGGIPALALAPLAVIPGHERSRAGTALMQEGLAEAARLGHRIVIVLGHPKYYRRFGFRPARPRGVAAPWPVPDAVFQVLELAPGALEGVAGTVRYPAAFDADVTP
ncbi:MAG: N-acetyltransferase [Chloroflexi bacterium]|nr:N-acetyltransferase [Chloroflexota bacterium]